jgi:hypothetical protein
MEFVRSQKAGYLEKGSHALAIMESHAFEFVGHLLHALPLVCLGDDGSTADSVELEIMEHLAVMAARMAVPTGSPMVFRFALAALAVRLNGTRAARPFAGLAASSSKSILQVRALRAGIDEGTPQSGIPSGSITPPLVLDVTPAMTPASELTSANATSTATPRESAFGFTFEELLALFHHESHTHRGRAVPAFDVLEALAEGCMFARRPELGILLRVMESVSVTRRQRCSPRLRGLRAVLLTVAVVRVLHSRHTLLLGMRSAMLVFNVPVSLKLNLQCTNLLLKLLEGYEVGGPRTR